MKSQTIKVLRGRLEIAVSVFDRAERNRLDEAEAATRVIREQNTVLLGAAFAKALFRNMRKCIRIDQRSNGCVSLYLTEEGSELHRKLRKQFEVGEDDGRGYAEIHCFSLGVRAGVRPATAKKFQPLFDAIDQQFINTDGADIEALINKFLA